MLKELFGFFINLKLCWGILRFDEVDFEVFEEGVEIIIWFVK